MVSVRRRDYKYLYNQIIKMFVVVIAGGGGDGNGVGNGGIIGQHNVHWVANGIVAVI